MKIIRKESPNFNDRKGRMLPSVLILHYTGTRTEEEADKIYMTPDQVSPHYMINKNGVITSYVAEDKRAWHAGLASWDGKLDINSSSIGIEIVNGGHEFGLEEFPAQQIENLIELIKDIRSRHKIPDYYVLGHSDVAPGRKIDPGEKFPWDVLHKAGIGLMPKDDGDLDISLEKAFREFGYDYTLDIDLLKLEFSRHYLFDKFGQATDEDISRALASLLKQKTALS